MLTRRRFGHTRALAGSAALTLTRAGRAAAGNTRGHASGLRRYAPGIGNFVTS